MITVVIYSGTNGHRYVPFVVITIRCHLWSRNCLLLEHLTLSLVLSGCRIRDRPFNLKGGGDMVFCFVRNFFPEFYIRLYDKNSESDYFFFLHQNQNIFFSNIGNQNIFLEKNIIPPFKLNGRSLTL
jgi:hypothetical protein